MSKRISDYIGIIKYNYHLYPSTWGKCMAGCGKDARGSGLCKDCAERGLAELVGKEKAEELHNAIKTLHKIERELSE